MDCVFERTSDPTLVRCGNPGCTNVLRVPDASYPLDRCHATCWSGVPEGERPVRHEISRPPGRDTYKFPCIYQHEATGESVNCGGCGGGLRALFSCDIYAVCLPWNVSPDYHSCVTCSEYKPVAEAVA